MGRLAITGDHADLRHQLSGDIAMEVHPGRDDAARPDKLANGGDEIPHGIVPADFAHRPVNVEKEAIERQCRVDPGQQLGFQLGIGSAGDWPAGVRPGPQAGDEGDVGAVAPAPGRDTAPACRHHARW